MKHNEASETEAALETTKAIEQPENGGDRFTERKIDEDHTEPLDDEECKVNLQHVGESLVNVDCVGARWIKSCHV